jgi:hypothetical protein
MERMGGSWASQSFCGRAPMSELSAVEANRLSSLLLSGPVDEALLRAIVDLKNIPVGLAKNMLMTLSDTDETRLRNILALTLARAGIKDAIPRIIRLLKDPKTSGARGTLLYALQKLHAILDLDTLISLILMDAPEAQEEALVLLEDTLEEGAKAADIQAALRAIANHYPPTYVAPSIVKDAREILEEALTVGGV